MADPGDLVVEDPAVVVAREQDVLGGEVAVHEDAALLAQRRDEAPDRVGERRVQCGQAAEVGCESQRLERLVVVEARADQRIVECRVVPGRERRAGEAGRRRREIARFDRGLPVAPARGRGRQDEDALLAVDGDHGRHGTRRDAGQEVEGVRLRQRAPRRRVPLRGHLQAGQRALDDVPPLTRLRQHDQARDAPAELGRDDVAPRRDEPVAGEERARIGGGLEGRHRRRAYPRPTRGRASLGYRPRGRARWLAAARRRLG